MIKKVQKLIDDFLETRPDIFLVDLKISNDNKIQVYVDGDNSVTLQDCLDISRAIEFNLDREEQDFSLDVSSPGIDTPLKSIRQYIKNNNREIEIITDDDIKYQGVLYVIDENTIQLTWSEKQDKQIGKGKIKVDVTENFDINKIKKAFVVLKF